MTSLEAMEAKLDAVAVEALRREACRLDLANASKERRAAAMSEVRARMKAWRDRAGATALRSAVTAGRAT